MRTQSALFALLWLVGAHAHATTHYVNANSTSAVSPYFSWATAASNIQQAVDAASSGDTILVTNGIYQTGGRWNALTTNRVSSMVTLAIKSVNGPAVTIIKGYQVPGTTNGIAAVRCVALADGSLLSGFTLTNGATYLDEGGGVNCGSVLSLTVISNCVITGNSAKSDGGGAYGGRYFNCVFVNNSSYGSFGGGGAYRATLTGCLLVSNTAKVYGGGVCYGSLNNCTAVGNFAGLGGGGAYNGSHFNSILYYNSTGTNLSNAADVYSANCTNCCIPQTNGLGEVSGANLTNAPLFVNAAAGNFRLQAGSPCINVGINTNIFLFTTNVATGVDLDGNNRVRGGTVDMGAYEFQAQITNTITAWLQQFSLPADGSATFADSDSDGINNAQEWLAGTDPTNAASALRILSAVGTASGPEMTWASVSNRTYSLERATNLADVPAFTVVQTNLPGSTTSTTFTDTGAIGSGSFFYRVRVEP